MSHRLQIVVPDRTYTTLVQVAAARESRPSTIAAAIVTDDLQSGPFRTRRATGHAPRVEPPELFLEKRHATQTPADDRQATVLEEASRPPKEPAAWLERGRGQDWRTEMWDAAMQLWADYPDLNPVMEFDWHTDRFTRDGILALHVWRRQIDEHAQNDPRLELQWLTALRDFCRIHEEHRRIHGGAHRDLARPADW